MLMLAIEEQNTIRRSPAGTVDITTPSPVTLLVKGMIMSTNDMQNTHAGNLPDDVTSSPEAASPPVPLVVVEFDGRCFHSAHATDLVRIVMVWTNEDFDEEDENVVEVDGKLLAVAEVSDEMTVIGDGTLEPDIAKVLTAAGIDVSGVSATATEGETASAEDES